MGVFVNGVDQDASGGSIADVAFDASFTIGAEAVDEIPVAVQLLDSAGAALAVVGSVGAYISTDSAGLTPARTGTVYTYAGTDGQVFAGGEADPSIGVAGIVTFVSEADGSIDIIVGDGTDTARSLYLNLIMPFGNVVTSGAITFADDTP
jgi:hypothetical protein